MLELLPQYGATRAAALGITAPVSPLLIETWRLKREQPGWASRLVSNWLLALANARGFHAAVPSAALPDVRDPGVGQISNEALAMSLMHPSAEDRPRLLRLATQVISRGTLREAVLLRVARMERAGRILAELARLALKVDPDHRVWQRIAAELKSERPFCTPLIDWTRLAEPIAP